MPNTPQNGQAGVLRTGDQSQLPADSLTIIDNIIDHARDIAKRGHWSGPLQKGDALEAYVKQHGQVVVYVGLGTGEEHEIVVRACGPIIRLDDPLSPVEVNYFHGMEVGKRGYKNPVFVGSTEFGENVEAIVPTAISVERPKVRTNFWRKMLHWLSSKALVEFRGGSDKGQVDILDSLGAVQPSTLGGDVVEGVFQFGGGVVNENLEIGVGGFDYSKLMYILSFFEVWFNDYGPRVLGTKPLDDYLQVVDMAFCAVEE